MVMKNLTRKSETHSQTSCFGTGSSGTCSPHGVGPQSRRLWEKRGGQRRRRWSPGGRCTAKTVERPRSNQVSLVCESSVPVFGAVFVPLFCFPKCLPQSAIQKGRPYSSSLPFQGSTHLVSREGSENLKHKS